MISSPPSLTRRPRLFRRIGLAVLFLSLSAIPLRSFEQLKLAVERALEDRLQYAFNKLVDPERFLIIVKIEPYTEEELKAGSKKTGSVGPSQSYVLPGIPERMSIEQLQSSNSKSASSDVIYRSRPFIKKIVITLFLDDKVDRTLTQKVEVLGKQLIDFNEARGDEFKIQRMAFRRAKPSGLYSTDESRAAPSSVKLTIQQFKENKDIYWMALVSLIGLTLMIFLFGPAMRFLKGVPSLMQQALGVPGGGSATSEVAAAASAAVAAAQQQSASGGGGGGGGSGHTELTLGSGGQPLVLSLETGSKNQIEIFYGEPESRPYNFINEQDIVNILSLLKEEPPLHLAIICYYLRPDLASSLISQTNPDVRKQIVDHLSSPQILMRDEVKSLGQTLRQKVRGIIYGMDQYFAIYDHAAPNTQNELIKALETQMPQLVEKIRTEMFSFDDLMTLDSTALRTVFREVPLRTLAVALMGTTTNVREKVLTVLPQGAAEIIRQEIEMNPIKSAKTIDDERRKIVQVVRKLVWDKKIVVPPRRSSTVPRPAATPSAPAHA